MSVRNDLIDDMSVASVHSENHVMQADPLPVIYFVEILSRAGEVVQRHRVAQLPIRLGRAYNNDFILDDVHTAPHHVEVKLDEQGKLVVQDVGSRNGIVAHGKRHSTLQIDGHTVMRLGQTNVRIRSSDFQVEEEAADTNNYAWEGWRPAALGLLLVLLIGSFSTWYGDTEKFSIARYIVALAPLVAICLLWSGIWSFANRLFGGHTRFGRHVFIAGCGMMASGVWSDFSGFFAYAFSWEWITRYGSHVSVIVGATMLYFHLMTIKPRAPRRWLMSSLLLAVLGSSLVLLSNYQRTGRLADELYMGDLFAPSVRVSSSEAVAQFMQQSAQLKAEVDSQRHGNVDADEIESDGEAE